jgi:putative ABC transport system permease protein
MPYFEQVVERLRALPGVTRVGSIQHLPMSGYNWTSQVFPSERPPAAGATAPTAMWRFIGWDYFETMRIPLVAGRAFNQYDTTQTTPVTIVNEALARREFGSVDAAIGRRIRATIGRGPEEAAIVGVIGDVRFMSLDSPSRPEMYRPLAQTFMFPMAFVVRTSGDPATLAAAVRQAAYAIDPAVPVAEMQTLNAMLAQSLGQPRLLTMLLMVFASVGLLLTLVGVYGVVAYWVRRREREFGIRVALGAAPSAIARDVLRQGALVAAIGIAAAVPAALMLTRLMRTAVYGITTHDPVTFLALPATVLAATLTATYLPARRAARVDPALTMKAE